MPADTKASVTTQVYEVYIRATPQAIWDAITSPEWTVKYGYLGAVEIELRPGGTYKALATTDMKSFGLPDVVVDGHREQVGCSTTGTSASWLVGLALLAVRRRRR